MTFQYCTSSKGLAAYVRMYRQKILYLIIWVLLEDPNFKYAIYFGIYPIVEIYGEIKDQITQILWITLTSPTSWR